MYTPALVREAEKEVLGGLLVSLKAMVIYTTSRQRLLANPEAAAVIAAIIAIVFDSCIYINHTCDPRRRAIGNPSSDETLEERGVAAAAPIFAITSARDAKRESPSPKPWSGLTSTKIVVRCRWKLVRDFAVSVWSIGCDLSWLRSYNWVKDHFRQSSIHSFGTFSRPKRCA